MNTLSLEVLPDLPQSQHIARIAPVLWQQPGVVALWLGGSLARGDADLYSDIDLRLGVVPSVMDAWKHPDFEVLFQGTCLGGRVQLFGETGLLHHLLLSTGDIYDLWVQSVEGPLSKEPVLLLGCRDVTLAQRLQQMPSSIPSPSLPVEAEMARKAIVDFWINTHKHRKVLHRGLHLLVLTGIQVDRSVLLRLWYILAMGQDCEMQQGIHGLTHMVRAVEHARGISALEVLGSPLTSRSLIQYAIEQLRDEVSQVGQELAQWLGFEYPHSLEQTVRRGWSEFLRES